MSSVKVKTCVRCGATNRTAVKGDWEKGLYKKLGGVWHEATCPLVSGSKSARRARGLVRIEVWIDPAIAATLEALRTKRNETSAQTVRAALLLLFQMQEGSTVPVRGFLLTNEIVTDAVARGVSSGMAAALSTNGRGAAKIQPTHLANGGTKGKCKRCGFVRCACLGGVKR